MNKNLLDEIDRMASSKRALLRAIGSPREVSRAASQHLAKVEAGSARSRSGSPIG